jgi:hypothetical protein
VWAYVAIGLTASGVHWLADSAVTRAVSWDVLGFVAVVGAWTGIVRNRPAHPAAWRLLGAGLTLLVAGDVIWDVSTYVFGHSTDSVPASDIVYLSAYPFLAAGLVLLARARIPGRDTLVDGIVVALVIAAPLWLLVVRPTIDSTAGTAFDQVVTAAYPILDCLLLVVVAYLSTHVSRRSASSTRRSGSTRSGRRRTRCSRPRCCTRRCVRSGSVSPKIAHSSTACASAFSRFRS